MIESFQAAELDGGLPKETLFNRRLVALEKFSDWHKLRRPESHSQAGWLAMNRALGSAPSGAASWLHGFACNGPSATPN